MLVLFQQCLKAVDYWAGPPRLLVEAAGLLSLVAFVSKDGIGGASPGKRLFDLEVVDRETRETAGFWASILRNLPTLLMPVALFAAAEVKSGRRLGEGWAGTMVIWRRYRYEPPFRGVRPICHACGYDLRGNESGRCPECGLEHEFGFVEPAMGKKVD